jgi:hypothetical protein
MISPDQAKNRNVPDEYRDSSSAATTPRDEITTAPPINH